MRMIRRFAELLFNARYADWDSCNIWTYIVQRVEREDEMRGVKMEDEEKKEKEAATAVEKRPRVTLQQACEAAAVLSRFIAENPSEFGPDAESEFYETFRVPLDKMMVKEIRQRRQGMLDRVSH